MKDKLQCKHGKVEILINYWDKFYGQIMFRASKISDQETIQLMKYIALVPNEVQFDCLHYYVDKCIELQAIAFL